MSYICGKFICENLGLLKEHGGMTSFSCKNQILENWVHWNAGIHYMKLREIAKNCAGLFKFHLLLSFKFTWKWEPVQKMDGYWSVRNLLWSISGPQAL